MPHNYNLINSHPRDCQLEFDEINHKYTHNGKELISVTTLIENCFEKFDADYWASRKAPQMGITPEDLKSRWEANAQRARELGTSMHDKIEKYYMGINCESDETFKIFLQFASQHTLHPYRTEWRIFDEQFGIAGTLDFLELNNGKFTIYDWKRSEKLIKNGCIEKESPFRKKALHPISHICDTTYWHYALQVSIYRYILEKNYSIEISHNRLAVFHPNNEKPYLIELPYLREEILTILNYHKQKLL